MSRKMIVPLVFGLFGAALLVGLGVWQIQRMAWKNGVIAEINARISQAAVEVPLTPTEALDEYLAVRADGRTVGDEVHVLISIDGYGTGYRVISRFETGGRSILLDRGFVPLALKDAARDPISGNITGNLLWPDEIDGFTPDPDFGANIWFARDLPKLAQALDTEELLVVLRNADSGNGGAAFTPIDSSKIRNNHLNYAITWFLMAIGWLGMTGYWVWSIRRRLD
jgi:surfeit locus 1 family protein